MITDPQHALTFGPLDLIGGDTSGPYYFRTIAEGTDWGNPAQTVRAIMTFLQDGAIQVVDGYGNRELVLEVKIVGEDSFGLAAGEQALMLEVARGRNLLVWTPPNIITGAGTPCVFDVVSSRLDHSLDDLGELHLERRYKLSVTALPWAHAEGSVTVVSDAPAGTTPTVTLIDACTSTSNWSGVPAAPTTSGGAVGEFYTNPYGTPITLATLSLTRTGLSTNMATAPYVRIEFTYSGDGRTTSQSATVKLNGITVAPAATNGNVRWYLSPAATLTSVAVSTAAGLAPNGHLRLSVFDVSRSDMATDAVGQRQRFMSLDVEGSVRTQGNLALEDPTAALGSTLIYTTPGGGSAAQPPLRAWRTAGSAETTDTSRVSGKYSDLATLHTFDIPAPNIEPGGYLLMALVKHASAATYALTWAGRSRMGSTNLGAGQSGVQSVALAAGVWTVVEVAKLTLPTVTLGPSGLVRIELTSVAGVILDEAWLFNVDTGRLTWVECGTAAPSAGGSANRLWLDAPTLEVPMPSVWMGAASDRGDAFGAGSAMRSFGAHEFVPPTTSVYLVTTNAVGADVSLTYSPAFHTHVVAS